MALPIPHSPRDPAALFLPHRETLPASAQAQPILPFRFTPPTCRLCGHPHAEQVLAWVSYSPMQDAPGGHLPPALTIEAIASYMTHLAVVATAGGRHASPERAAYLKTQADTLLCWALERLALNPMALYVQPEATRGAVGAIASDWRAIARLMASGGDSDRGGGECQERGDVG